MKYIELNLSLKLKKNISYRELPEEISKGINFYFLSTEELKRIHKKNDFKLYTFGSLIPIERDKMYKKDKSYKLVLRFMDIKLLNDFYKGLAVIENPIFSIISRCFNVVTNSHEPIEYIETLTPAVINYNNRNLDIKNMDLNLVRDRVTSNTNKKYSKLLNLDSTYFDFIEDIEILNNKSVVFNYKSGVIIGNKYRIKIKKDKVSQELAFMCLGAGILEKNSLSFGFCRAITNGGEIIA